MDNTEQTVVASESQVSIDEDTNTKKEETKEEDDLDSMQILDSIQAGDEADTYDPTVPSENTEGNEGAAENVTNGEAKPDVRRMSGAARKRYKYFIAHGHSKEESRKLALDKTVKISDWSKFEELQKSENRSRLDRLEKEDAEIVKVGILPEGYPLVSLAKDDMEGIQGNILNKVLEKGGEIKPKFLGMIFKTGWFILKCANKATADWIKEISSEVQGPNGQSLKIVDNTEVPKTIMMYAYFPKSAEDTDDKVLQLIAAQNDKLNVSQWRVTEREIEGPALRLSIAVDPASDEVLQELEYRVAYKFGFVNLRTEDKEKERKAIKKKAPPPPPRKRARPPLRKPSPPRRREPKRFGRDRGSDRRGRGRRFEDRAPRRGGSPRFGRRERDRRRDDRPGRRDRRLSESRASQFGYGSDLPPLPKMPPQNFPGGWNDGPMFGHNPKSNDEMSIYYTQLKSLEEYNRSMGQNSSGGGGGQGQGTWYTQQGGNYNRR